MRPGCPECRPFDGWELRPANDWPLTQRMPFTGDPFDGHFPRLAPPLTEADVRRIVREELARNATTDGEDSEHG